MKRSLLPALLLAAAVPAIHAATVYDNFNHPQWTVSRAGIGPVVHESNERLELVFPASSRVAPGESQFQAGYASTCLLHGDFDVRVKYSLPRFPPANGVRVGLTFAPRFAVERISFGSSDVGPPGEYYLFHGNSITYTPTSDRWGRLRAVRQNGLISAYYFDSSSKSWQFIGSSAIPTEDIQFWIGIWSHDWAFADKFTKVAFDNLVVSAGTLVGPKCPFAK
jgi:hypothetical protein